LNWLIKESSSNDTIYKNLRQVCAEKEEEIIALKNDLKNAISDENSEGKMSSLMSISLKMEIKKLRQLNTEINDRYNQEKETSMKLRKYFIN
jgi:hypothetical protein